ncbi:MAG: sugar phosphate nucleotidyltransferase, partial [Victivallaceae bacterium]|nr:sugar phosphate nucleotidyltransferase [Victivallaceae bacterium]
LKFEVIFIFTNLNHVEGVRSLLPQLPAENVIGEPQARDTAPCAALAAGIARARYGGDVEIIMLPADHRIVNTAAFHADLELAGRFARMGKLVTLGVEPTYPSPDYGYIECGRELDDSGRVREVRCFIEKPDRVRAQSLIDTGRCRWNSGMFVWLASSIEREFERCAPELAKLCKEVAAAWGRADFAETLKDIYASAPRTSIDYAVMEKSMGVVLVSASFEWDDVGNWISLRNHLAADGSGNVFNCRAAFLESHDCVVFAEDHRHTAGVIGVDDLVIVNTPDATLVARADAAPRLKELLKKMEPDQR